MKLIVGLGNPGEEYQKTLHNVGFAVVEALAVTLGLNSWNQKFKGQIAKGTYQGNSLVLLKPQTYMNLSGEAVVACKQFFKIEISDILVISDDIDLPAGYLRYRKNGGHGGHNGLRSIIQLSGDSQFHRLRIGIGRPKFKSEVSNFLLSKPSDELSVLLAETLKSTEEHLLNFIQGSPIQIKSPESLNNESDS